ncbi:MAG: xylose isomerase [Pirellulaceae bacterium]|nr:MAG: xylose isomerase [Pirellulaceae bacterium]
MCDSDRLTRRGWLQTAAVTVACGAAVLRGEEESRSVRLAGRIYKSLKIGMVKVPGSLADRFRAAKQAGFDGIELSAPGLNIEETRDAIAQTGLVVDGTVCASHWQIRHTSPDAGVRREALAHLRAALRETHAVGGHSVLLVVGHGQDGPEEEIWPRAIENIAQAIPDAARWGVYIAIENVWNHFLYDHNGGPDQTADKFVRFVDELNSPWVGMQFDIGNHWKYGNPADWIRQLGRRIVKLDVKGFSRKDDRFTAIGEGDIPWDQVRAALAEIQFAGWAAAEVAGGDEQALRNVASAMGRVFGLV